MKDVPYPTREEFRADGRCGVEQFKDPVCGYSGCVTWCDRTRKKCTELGNIERFDCAMPAIVEPWRLPVWEVLCGAGMLVTMLVAPPWHIAGVSYSVFALLILPPVREMLYYRYLHRSSEQDSQST